MNLFNINESSSDRVAIGLTKEASSGEFRWSSDRELVTDVNWGAPTWSSIYKDEGSVSMDGKQNWAWSKNGLISTAKAVCQRAPRTYNTSYVAVIPYDAMRDFGLSKLTVLSSTGSVAPPLHIYLELTTYPGGGMAEEKTLDKQTGLHFQKTLSGPTSPDSDTQDTYVHVQTTEAIQLVLVLWTQDLASVSSAFIFPANPSRDSPSFFAPTTPASVSLGMISIEEDPTHLDVALEADIGNVSLTINSMQFDAWPVIVASKTLTDQHQLVHMYLETVTGLTRAPFIHANGSVGVFSMGRESPQSDAIHNDLSFEQVLPVDLVGNTYVTFPSLPRNAAVTDTFTIVAVLNNTDVTVFLPNLIIKLERSGDKHDLRLPATGFHYVHGSKPFYMYAKLGGSAAGGGDLPGTCTLTLMSENLWDARYSLHIAEPWTLMDDVYVVLVGVGSHEAAHEVIRNAGSRLAECNSVKGSAYVGCIVKLLRLSTRREPIILAPQTGSDYVFAAYLYARRSGATACHPLGALDVPSEYSPEFNASAYLEDVKTDDIFTENESTTPNEGLQTETHTTDPIATNADVQTSDAVTTVPPQGSTSVSSVATTIAAYTPTSEDPTLSHLADAPEATPGCPQEEYIRGRNLNLSTEELWERMLATSNFLRVDRRNTSSFRRAKTSVQDYRVSSVSLGVFGMSLIFIFMGIILLSDIRHCITLCDSSPHGLPRYYR